jgi:Uma2 family endonuclease
MSEAPAVPSAGAWTLADLERLPDTGSRYEIVDGSLLVSPPPSLGHAIVVESVARVLRAAASVRFSVFVSGPGLALARSVYVPDVVVVETAVAVAEPRALPPAAVPLVVEVLSPGNRTTDLVTKRTEYAAAGIPHYWIVDPDVPSLLALRLQGREYIESARVDGNDPYRTTDPFEVVLVPGQLRHPPAGLR